MDLFPEASYGAKGLVSVTLVHMRSITATKSMKDILDVEDVSEVNETHYSLQFDFGDSSNSSYNETMDLPIDMRFSDGHLLSVIVYSILMIISAVGNLSVLNSMIKIRMKARLNRVNLLLLHLAIADLFVTFLMMPLEIGWNITVSWKAGDFMCRLMSFFRTFGLYLSGFIVICISFDRYFAVLRPLALPEANKRGRLMLYLAWCGSVLCSLPQSWVFHLESHPVFTWYEQCITLNTFVSDGAELAYNFFGFTFMYGLPMVVIVFCYSAILYEIYKVNALRKNGEELRRSSMEALTRAKVRTLKMTVVIVAIFFLCWTPYNVMSLWYWFDKESARTVDHRIQKGLFLFACTNSCANPLIYGLFHIRSHKRRKSELRIRQTLMANNHNCRLERLDRPPYGIRVRWKPRDCLCSASGSSSDSKPGHVLLANRNGNHQNSNHNYSHHHRGTRTTGIGDNFYGSQRKSRNTTLIPLTSREFNRHVPLQLEQNQKKFPLDLKMDQISHNSLCQNSNGACVPITPIIYDIGTGNRDGGVISTTSFITASHRGSKNGGMSAASTGYNGHTNSYVNVSGNSNSNSNSNPTNILHGMAEVNLHFDVRNEDPM